MVAGPISGTVDLMEHLRSRRHRIFAITNFSAEKWNIACNTYPFLTSFEDAVVSGVEKISKPDRQIFELLLARNALSAKDCFFIDDSPVNVEGAKQVGMRGAVFESVERLREDLTEHGILP